MNKPKTDLAKRKPSPLRCSSSSKRVKCAKDQVLEEDICELVTKRSCHQCQQKLSFLVASCKNQINTKLCTFHFCQKCLSNRYGEKAEDIVLLSDWKCPKCRDICNCNRCMKKIEKQPTGMLVKTANATGFPSVSEMLISKENESLNLTNVVKDVGSSPKKPAASSKETAIALLGENGKGNYFAGKNDSNLITETHSRELAVALLENNGKENSFAGKKDSKKQANLLTSYFDRKNAGECKRKSTENGDSNGIACQGREDAKSKQNLCNKSKVLKERNSNSNKNEEKIEKRDCSAIAETKSSKKSSTVKKNPQTSIKEEEKKVGTNKNTDNKVALCKDISQMCIKKFGKVVQLNRSCSVDEKNFPDCGNIENDQAVLNPTLNSTKTEDLEKVKCGSGPAITTSKKSPIAKEIKPTPTKEEEKNSESIAMLFDMSESPIQNSEEISQGCIDKEDVLLEGKSSQPVDEIIWVNSENDDYDQAMLNLNSAVCEVKKTQNPTFVDIPMPKGVELTKVAGIDLPVEDVGHALQFLEFCTAFGQFFHLKKGQPEAILRELTCGRSRRSRMQYSSVVQFHIQLLSLLLEDSGEKSISLSPTNGGHSWLQALGKCISESACTFDELPSNCFNKDDSGYYMLDLSKRLRLLNFLCDEALCTADLRTWIDDQNSKILEKEKEAKQKVVTAKDKEKRVKQQMQDEIEKAIVSGKPLSISEHDALVSKMKMEAEAAHTEFLEAITNIPKKKRSDAVRTDSLLFDGNGNVFWSLKSYSGQPDLLVQDIGNFNSVAAGDKWLTYDIEQKGTLDRYISSRGKRVKIQKVPNVAMSDTCQALTLSTVSTDH